jgi:hypothetical protein
MPQVAQVVAGVLQEMATPVLSAVVAVFTLRGTEVTVPAYSVRDGEAELTPAELRAVQ